jgi:glutamate N-acetyltransferase/amino-acid N-acetyltransferase
MAIDVAGSVTSPVGFEAGATYAGMKTYGDGKLALGFIKTETMCTAAAVHTRNRLYSASIDVNRAHLADRQAQAVVCNAGIANSSTGARGIADARTMCDQVGAKLGIRPADVLVCSTGVIGHYLPMEKVAAGIDAVELGRRGGIQFALAIMTTDTRPKHASVVFGDYVLGGCAKGSGMIHPNMATMLAFLTTDAPIEAGFLQETLSAAVDASFNLVSVDGDTSPSDTVILLANGARGGPRIGKDSALAASFTAALTELCTHLAKEIARDGEGATKLLEVRVSGATNTAEARNMARLMTTSYLLKSAVHGADPNWGRIVTVIGRSGLHISEPGVTVAICGQRVFEHEQPTEFDPEAVAAAMRADEVLIEVALGVGTATATAWGCDLTAEYVSINADYHT